MRRQTAGVVPRCPADPHALPARPGSHPGGNVSTTPVPPPECPAHAAAAAAGSLHRLHGPEAQADPLALYEKLRAEHGAVAPVLVSGDLPAWLVLGHRENLDVARTSSRFARDPRGWRDMKEGRVPADTPLGPMVSWVPVCNFTDGPVHERLRSAVVESLERFDKRGIRRHVTRFANQLVDQIAGEGYADLVSAFSDQLPMLVMTQLIGAPDEHGPLLVNAARDMLQGTETALQSDRYVTATLEHLVVERKARPVRDLASWLIEHPANLSDTEVLMHLRVVLIAAYETTANLIANTLRTVLTDPRFRASLSGGHMTLPDALEQVLWDDPPINTIIGRWATGDTLLGGREVKAGDMILLGLAAGNADPQIRPDPAASVHGNRSHLAFSSGPHECPGQDIGRAIADTGIEVLLDRLPDLQLAVDASELQWRGTLMSRHLLSLPVRFAPRPVPPAQPQKEQPAEHPVHAPVPPRPTTAPTVSGRRRRSVSWWRRLLGLG
ncbi:cytochrome [Streptomyces venezuelae]|uniref:Cytochrome n=1 Tax=Streptomyces venezuelae TaxID=54571 RepID=A0A5P2DXY9_STRVZ|nr:cytochrome [Streptomyces venezuelae]